MTDVPARLYRPPNRQRGKVITCNIGRKYVNKIDALINDRAVINRSSFMRDAVTYALYKILVAGDTKYLEGLEEAVSGSTYLVTINLTPLQVDAIDALVPNMSRSRSSFIRDALVLFTRQTEKFLATVKALKATPPEPKRQPGKTIDMRRVRW